MKKTFKNLLALFVTGTMLAGVGCKDYDDDINNLKQEVEDLKGQIALKADATALNALSQKIDGIDFDSFLTAADLADYVTKAELDEELASYLKTSDLNSKVVEIVKTLGYQTKDDVMALIDGMMTEEDVLTIFKEQIAAGETWNTLLPKVQEAIQSALDEYTPEAPTELTEGQKTQVEGLITEAVKDKMDETGVKTLIASVLGTDFASYMEKYMQDMPDAFVAGVSASVLKDLQAEQSALATAIESMITASLNDGISEANVAYLKANDLQTKFAEYDKKIDAIWGAIEDLAGRIQSIVFVPTTVDQEVSFGGYYIGTGANKITLASTSIVEMAFRVAPAKIAGNLAQQITDEKVTVSFIPEAVSRANEEPITYQSVEATEDGKLIFTVVGDVALYEKLAAEDKTYAVALSLSQEAQKDEETGEYTTMGFEITSPYFVTNGASTDETAKFVLAKEEDGKFAAEYETVAAYEMPWNSTETITLYNDYALYYKDGNDYLTMGQAAEKYNWDEGVAEAMEPQYTHTGITYKVDGTGTNSYDTQTQFTVTPKDVTTTANKNADVTVAVKTASKDNVGDVLTLSSTVAIKNGTKTVALSNNSVEATVTVMGDLIHTFNFDLNFIWNYTQYAANSYEVKVTVPEDKKMKWEQFNQLPASFSINLSANENIKVTSGQTAKLTFTRTTAINQESTQQFTVTLTNYVTGDGTIAYTKDKELDSNNSSELYVKFAGNVTFEGLPALNYTIADGSLGADYNVTLDAKFNETLYEQASKYFDDADDVATFISALTLDCTSTQQTKSGVLPNLKLGSVLALNSGNTLVLDIDSDGINWNEQTEYTYTAPEKAAIIGTANDIDVFKLNVTGSYVLSNDNIYALQPNTAHLYEGEAGANPYIYLNGKVSGNTFTLENIDLTNAYFATEQALGESATLTFALVDGQTPVGSNQSLPTISGNTMTWNGCVLDKVTVKATLKNSNQEILDEKIFDVVVKAPITFDWNFAQNTVIEVPTAGTSFNLAPNVLACGVNGGKPGVGNEAIAQDIYGNAIYTYSTDTAASLSALAKSENGYNIKVSYSDIKWKNENDNIAGVTVGQYGLITVPASNIQLAKAIEATVTVTYTYKYAWVLNEAKDDYVQKTFSFEIPLTFQAAE